MRGGRRRGEAQGTAARCRRHGEERGPLSWPAPAARRVIASPGQASRVRPLLRTISTPLDPLLPPPSPFPRDWRSIGPHRAPALPLPPLSAASFSSRSVVSSIPRRPPRALFVLVLVRPRSPPRLSLFIGSRPLREYASIAVSMPVCFCVFFIYASTSRYEFSCSLI